MKNVVLALGLIWGVSAVASPYKYTKCDHKLVSPKNSAGYVFSKDCRTAYVLPPQFGKLSVTGYSPALTDQQCDIKQTELMILGDLVSYSRDMAKELIRFQGERQSLNVKLMKYQMQCESINSPLVALKSQRDSFQTQIDNLNADSTELESKIAACESNGQSCRIERRTLRQNTKLIKKYSKFVANANPKISQIEAKYQSCQSTVENRSIGLRQQIENLGSSITQITDLIDAYVTDYDEIISAQQEIPGASVQLSFQVNQNEIVEAFKKANTALQDKVNFVAMPTKKMNINFSAVLDGIEAKVPVVLSSDIPGISSVKETGDQSDLGVDSSQLKSVMMGQALNGGVVINQLAACNFQNSNNRSKFSATLIANVQYEYDVTVQRKYKVDYLESHLYKLIKKSSTSGGLFRTKSSTSITEKSVSKQWIDIHIMNNDSDFDFADREKLAEDLKKEYLDRALMNVTLGFLKEGHPSLPAPSSQNGASTASAGLKKCPNLYCQSAALVLDIGNSIFGGTSSSASQHKFASAERGIVLDEHKAIPQIGTLSFIME
ncbi:MAG: hypothetical protein VX583_04850 [Bdellovibrionota bacterium]|nr:hypothetical protein [Pseudobdellovibrionaceae bacterium]|tara:strand:+ start:206603 stop:208249 length:1647 start_codon:yes stop_codon:yes gene_type:complete